MSTDKRSALKARIDAEYPGNVMGLAFQLADTECLTDVLVAGIIAEGVERFAFRPETPDETPVDLTPPPPPPPQPPVPVEEEYTDEICADIISTIRPLKVGGHVITVAEIRRAMIEALSPDLDPDFISPQFEARLWDNFGPTCGTGFEALTMAPVERFWNLLGGPQITVPAFSRAVAVTALKCAMTTQWFYDGMVS